MDSSTNFQLRANAFEIIQNYRVPDLQALLKYARLSQQGNKRELLQRCKILLSSNVSSQLLNKINQIEIARLNTTTKSHNISSIRHPIITSNNNVLPLPNHIEYVHLPFFEKIRTIECVNIPVNCNTFNPLRFILTDFDMDLIVKGLAKIFLRIVPTIISERQNDVLPPYLVIQCNSQIILNNNIAKTAGSQAHTIAFPMDITDKLIFKSNIQNILNYYWIQLPINMSFKNLPQSYTLSIQFVRCISLDNLVNNILKREFQTTTMINNNNNDSDIEIEDLGLMTTRHRVSLICPITQKLIHLPVKSINCLHLTCFDLRSFLQMNEKRLQWLCPICKKSASYETLHADKRLQSILSNVPSNCSTVEIDSSKNILSDCQYIIDTIKQEKSDTIISQNKESPIKKSNTSDCIVLSSEDEDDDDDDGDDDDLFNQNNLHSFESNVDDGGYWEDLARITYDLFADDNNGENRNRKRSNSSSNSSLLSNNDQQRKRLKQSRTDDDIDIITLSSASDNSDNDEDLS